MKYGLLHQAKKKMIEFMLTSVHVSLQPSLHYNPVRRPWRHLSRSEWVGLGVAARRTAGGGLWTGERTEVNVVLPYMQHVRRTTS